jgi:hypothetical protein
LGDSPRKCLRYENRSSFRSYGRSSLSVARAYPDGDPRNYRNTAFISAHFEINRCIRNLKADGVIPSSDAETALIADFQSLQTYPDVDWWDVPSGEVYAKILADEKALEPSLKFKPVTRKKFHRDEKALDAAIRTFKEE